MTPIYNPTPGAAAGLLVRRSLACAEAFYPAAPPATLTTGAGAWAPGAWVDVGFTSRPLALNYLHVVNYGSITGLVDCTVEVAYGAGYTPLDCGRELAPLFNPGPDTLASLPLSQMCQPVAVPAGETLYMRATAAAAGPYNVKAILLGWLYGLPVFATIPLGAIAGPGRWYPANTGIAIIATTSGAGWTWGAGATVVDPAPSDMLVVGIKAPAAVAYLVDAATMWQVGYGAAGLETWAATMAVGHTWAERWLWPPVLVKAGERLAVRSAWGIAQARSCQLKVYDL